MNFSALACHNATRSIIQRQSALQSIWISDRILDDAYQRFVYRASRHRGVSDLASAEASRELPPTNAAWHGTSSGAHVVDPEKLKNVANRKNLIEIHKGGQTHVSA